MAATRRGERGPAHSFCCSFDTHHPGFKGLFIGIDRYASPETNWLSCANRDATALHALFTDTLGGETMLLTDEQATVAAIRERFGQLANCIPDDVVVIAFSGHGTETHELVGVQCEQRRHLCRS